MPEPVVSGAVTIPHVLSAVAERSPDAIAIEDGITGCVHSFGDLISTTESRSRSLATNIPVKSRVAIIMDGGSELSLWLLAIMWRHTVVPFSPHLSVDEVRRYLMLTKARWLIAETPNEPLAAMCRDEGITLTSSSAVLASLDAGASTPQPNEVDTAREHDIAAVLLTSGSTSTPKVVPLTHRNLMTGAAQVGRSLDLTSRDRCLVLWAQHHIGGIVDLLLAPLAAGGTIINGGSFSLETFWSLLRSGNPTWIQFVPTTLDETLRDSERRSEHLVPNSLRFVRCVAAPITPSLWEQAEAAFGCPLVHTYGMTEASPLITSTPLDSSLRVRGSSGRSQGTEIRVADDLSRPVQPGIDGAILLRGPNVFAGYETDAGVDESSLIDGWFCTGDLGHIDANGELFVIGREKNMINRGGEKINPSEVEDVLRRHPLATDAAVFVLPHKRLGHIVGAAVSTDSALTTVDLLAFAKEHLAPHKVPAQVQILPELPRNEVGKIDRLTLAARATASTSARSTAFRTSTEALIAQIWSDELDAENLSPTVPFTVAGGDSLSALRVVAEIESRFSVSGHAQALLRASTIRDMAAIVDSLRTSASPAPQLSTEPPLPGWDNSLQLEDFIRLIVDAKDDLRNDSLQQLSLTHLCGHEIDTVVREVEKVNPLRFDEKSPLRRWRHPGQEFFTGSNSYVDKTWSRTVLHEWVTLYRADDVSPAGTTVIGFTALSSRLNLPISCILANVPESVRAIVLVNDPSRRHYAQGIPSLSDDAASLPRAIHDLIPDDLQGNLRTIGASAGGLISAVAAFELSARSFGMSGVDSLDRHPPIRERLTKLTSERDSHPHGRVVVGTVKRDWRALGHLREVVPEIEAKRYLPARHAVLFYAWRFGRLRPLLKWLFND
jgi:acyl-CoA synthetase (AMP-forming)/AMP-acid ligase II/acyl carrier protein